MSMSIYLGVDIGGSHIGIGIVDNKSHVIAKDSIEFDRNVSPIAAVDLIFNGATRLLRNMNGAKLESIGIGCPGMYILS